MPMLLRLLATNTSGEVVTARLAGDARMSPDTVSRYVGLLELVGFVVRILTGPLLESFVTMELMMFQSWYPLRQA